MDGTEEVWSREEAIADWARFVDAVETGYPQDFEAYKEGLLCRSMIQLDLDDFEEEVPEECRRLDERFKAATEPWPDLREWLRDDDWYIRRPLLLIEPLRSEVPELTQKIADLPDIMPFLREAAGRSWSSEGFAEIRRSLEALSTDEEMDDSPRVVWLGADIPCGTLFVRADSPLAFVQQECLDEVTPILTAGGYVAIPYNEDSSGFRIDYPEAARLFPHWDWDQYILEAKYRVATLGDLLLGTED